MARAIKLISSNEVLRTHDGRTNENVLELLLSDISLEQISKDEHVIVTHEIKVQRYKPSNSSYPTKTEKVRVSQLYDLYRRLTGQPYVPAQEFAAAA